ncbi:type II secretion system F family protein [Cysteiniphilum sp. 6C5]|uniref:type II secretion system F family protein n=1 Tax=unclassified Cysteiniphilum TaxID=2610889 RepID=UPI003F836CA1
MKDLLNKLNVDLQQKLQSSKLFKSDHESLYSSFKRKLLKLQFTAKKRRNFYDVVKRLLNSGFSFENILDQMIKEYEAHKTWHNDMHLYAQIAGDIHHRMEHVGLEFHEAVSIYIPEQELMILASERQASVNTLKNVIHVSQSLEKMRGVIVQSLLMPVVYIALMFAMVGIAYYALNPIMQSADNMTRFNPSTLSLYHFSSWFAKHYVSLLIGIMVFIAICIWSVLYFTHEVRYRFLDTVPPYLVYKNLAAIRFLLALSLMISGHNQVSIHAALVRIGEHATNYLSRFIDRMIDGVAEAGTLPGKVIAESGLFNAQIACLIAMYANSNELEKGIYELANNYLDEQINRIKKMFTVINITVTAIVIMFSLWFMYAVMMVGQGFS